MCIELKEIISPQVHFADGKTEGLEAQSHSKQGARTLGFQAGPGPFASRLAPEQPLLSPLTSLEQISVLLQPSVSPLVKGHSHSLARFHDGKRKCMVWGWTFSDWVFCSLSPPAL